MMIKNNRITPLLSFFLFFFFNTIYSQIYVSEGASVYVEKNTLVTQNLENVTSHSRNLTESYSQTSLSTEKTEKNEKLLAAKKAKSSQPKKLIAADKKGQKPSSAKKKEKTYTFYHRYTNTDDCHFTTSDSTKKPIISPDQHLKWDVSKSGFTFASVCFYEKVRIFYKTSYLHNRNNQAFRTRPPPISLS
ncbi:hypothetical protein [Epilithonimonas mollis]|uniref:Uncharacterized protein n=1 Tax=Epilithonimonas mollis TaxID=216903 RepID=A0A1M6TBX7_9FLAO|nr:hypothetical protein [Epilithonimonas mollis]SHK54507.1 hypothetical protein SAMN05444371_2780 [Epilithonimonas mollis]